MSAVCLYEVFVMYRNISKPPNLHFEYTHVCPPSFLLQRLENELAHREQTVRQLKNQVEKLESVSAQVPSDIRAKVSAVTDEWQNVKRNADRRDQTIRAVSSQSDQ